MCNHRECYVCKALCALCVTYYCDLGVEFVFHLALSGETCKTMVAVLLGSNTGRIPISIYTANLSVYIPDVKIHVKLRVTVSEDSALWCRLFVFRYKIQSQPPKVYRLRWVSFRFWL